MLKENAEKRRKIAVHVVSMADGGAGVQTKEAETPQTKSGTEVVQDLTVFKSSHGMYPLVQPYINITRKGNKSKL